MQAVCLSKRFGVRDASSIPEEGKSTGASDFKNVVVGGMLDPPGAPLLGRINRNSRFLRAGGETGTH